MTILFPTYEQLVSRIRADVAANLPDIDPTIYGSVIRAICDSFAGRAYDIVQLQKQLIKQLMPQTASDEYLERWAEYEGLSRISATAASGYVTFTGTASSVIPIYTDVKISDGSIYKTQTAVVIADNEIDVTSITRSGTTATVTTDTDHNFATGMTVTISGANETDYNGDFVINVTDTDMFTYTVSGTPTTPATGTIIASSTSGHAEVLSDDYGLDYNLDSGASLSLLTPISGIDTIGYVQYTGVTGGADDETDTELLVRVLQSRSNPVANFNVGAIEKACLAVAGVTRVWVQRITPDVGQVTIYFMRDNDDDPIPSGAEITEVETAVLALLPANSDEDDVFVDAPSDVSTAFTFSAITPDTLTMRTAIEANLLAFFADETDIAVDVTEDKYRSAIINTVDPDTGDALESFTLSTPSGDISISTGEIGTLGVVTFP